MSDPGPPAIRCENCGRVKPDVRPAPDCNGRPLCNACWFVTRPDPPRPRSSWEA